MAKATRKTSSKKAARRTTATSKPSRLKAWKGVVATAWKDQAFKERLLTDPNSALAERGFKPKKGVSYHVVVDSKSTKHLILPESAVSVKVKKAQGEPDPGF
jgi:nitrile hydratase alpha subunit